MSYQSRYAIVTLLILITVLCPKSDAAQQDIGPRLGIQTYTLRNMNFDQVVEFAVKHGITHLQFIKAHFDPDAPAHETRRKLAILQQHGLVPYTFGVARTSTDTKANRKLFEFAKLIGAKLIVVEPRTMAEWDNLEQLVREYDIKLAIHNHGKGTVYGDPATVKQVLAARDPRIGVCLDVGWVTAAGFDPAQVFRDYGDRVFDIHFKDKKVPTEKQGATTDTVLGSGDANYPGLFAEILRSSWSGVMAIETDSEEFAANPQPFVTSAAAFFSQSKEDWITLFNGRNLEGWTPKITHHDLGENFGNTFRVDGGLLKVRYDQYKAFDGQFGHLFYKTPYSYYRIVVEYRFVGEQAPGGPGDWALRNNGVMLHSQDPHTMLRDQTFPASIEAQLFGGLSNGKPRRTMNVCSPGTEIVYESHIYPQHCLKSTSKTFDGDQWVRAEMVVLGTGVITHFVNGEKVLEYSMPQYSSGIEDDFGVNRKAQGQLLEGGYISLQSESHPIDFRKVELLNLAGCMDPKSKNYKSYYVKSEPEQCIF